MAKARPLARHGTARSPARRTNADVGEHAVTLQVQDTGGLTFTQPFTIARCQCQRRTPLLRHTMLTTTAGITYTYDITTADIDQATSWPSRLAPYRAVDVIDNGNGTARLTVLATLAHLGAHPEACKCATRPG